MTTTNVLLVVKEPSTLQWEEIEPATSSSGKSDEDDISQRNISNEHAKRPITTVASDTDDEKARKQSKKPRSSDGKPRRVYKPTHQVRKEEKEALTKEVKVLETCLDVLRKDAQPLVSEQDRQKIREKQLVNGFLREAICYQQTFTTKAQSMMSGYMCNIAHIPFEMYIHLGKDLQQRRDTLTALKPKKLTEALRYITERKRYLDPCKPFTEETKFVTPNGDYCALIFDITPFEGVDSVKAVNDAVHFTFFNLEIRISEILGETTIREDDGMGAMGICENRFVSSITETLEMETSEVMFSQFCEQDGKGQPYGILTADFVDVDELFPYRPKERLRQDVTTVITIESHPRKKKNALGEEEEEQLVVVTRAALVKLHHSDLQVPIRVMHGLRSRIGRCGDLMLNSVRDIVYGAN